MTYYTIDLFHVKEMKMMNLMDKRIGASSRARQCIISLGSIEFKLSLM